ncbi:MAG: DUF167 domain-containing protein [Candidatus Aenigmarchaeota archaeon]|nr:DUF167 domain-containing protein [Candidatus Aenigmarchaeota archaeon]
MSEQNTHIDITVKLNNSRFRIEPKDGNIQVFVTERPQDNKANQEIIKNFEKLLGKNVKIAKGAKSRRKTLRIEGITEQEARQKLGV